jgi:hypothetical protein
MIPTGDQTRRDGRHASAHRCTRLTGKTTVLVDRLVKKGVEGFIKYQGDFPER